jgi:hypothetical protein
MTHKVLGLIVLSASWVLLAGCEPQTGPESDTPVAEGLPSNESRPADRQLAEGIRREPQGETQPQPARPPLDTEQPEPQPEPL